MFLKLARSFSRVTGRITCSSSKSSLSVQGDDDLIVMPVLSNLIPPRPPIPRESNAQARIRLINLTNSANVSSSSGEKSPPIVSETLESSVTGSCNGTSLNLDLHFFGSDKKRYNRNWRAPLRVIPHWCRESRCLQGVLQLNCSRWWVHRVFHHERKAPNLAAARL
jgi:hypothetical protein